MAKREELGGNTRRAGERSDRAPEERTNEFLAVKSLTLTFVAAAVDGTSLQCFRAYLARGTLPQSQLSSPHPRGRHLPLSTVAQVLIQLFLKIPCGGIRLFADTSAFLVALAIHALDRDAAVRP